jgi:hypothetical protein
MRLAYARSKQKRCRLSAVGADEDREAWRDSDKYSDAHTDKHPDDPQGH